MRERHGREWQPEETQALKEAIESGQSIANVALALGRSQRATRIRAIRLGLIPAPEVNTTAPTHGGDPESRKPLPDSRIHPYSGGENADDEGDPLPTGCRQQ